MKKHPSLALILLLVTGVLASTASLALESAPPASPEVTAAIDNMPKAENLMQESNKAYAMRSGK